MPKKKNTLKGYRPLKEKQTPYDYQERLNDIVRKGKSYTFVSDIYHKSLEVSWFTLVMGIIAFYFLTGILFAIFYYLLKNTFDPPVKSFEDSFFIAMNIFNSQGTGDYVAKGFWVKFANVLQGLVATLLGATVTGIIFARFSKPEARIKFADSLLRTKFNGKDVLQFRVANERDNFCYGVCLRFAVFFAETNEEGLKMRRLHELPLEQSDVLAFGLSVIGQHIIDENSVLYNLSIQDLLDRDAQFIIFFTGTDAVFGEDVQANRVFSPMDIVKVNGHFSDMIGYSENEKHKLLDLTKLNSYTTYSKKKN